MDDISANLKGLKMRCQKTGCGGEVIDGVCKSCAASQSAGVAVADSVQEQAVDKTASPGAASSPAPMSIPAPVSSPFPVSSLSPVSSHSLAAAQPGQDGVDAQLGNSEANPANQTIAADHSSANYPGAGERSAELKLQKVSARLKKIDGKEALLQASEALKTVVPDKFESWRAQADLWLAAIRQLQTRELNPDDSVLLMGVPLIERNLRDAAEEALRQCAHFAPTFEHRVALIDEANNIRNMSWF